ncbi:MAG TPA: hypothetical protein VN461_19165 [Vicinamibacteria bacterium]|nr:hypothetical protein [Vicinamibacteria bacterium]
MACDRHESDLREAALGAPLSVELESHLEGCLSCRAALGEEESLLRAIDQGLAAGLGIEPSPTFPARVRRGAENDHARSWLPLAAGMAALAVGVGLLIRGGGNDRPLGEPTLVIPSATRAARPVPPETSAPPPRAVPFPAVTPGARPAKGEPVVLVPPGQELALLHFREALRGREISPTSLLAAEEAGQAPLEPAELGVPPLEVKALPAPEPQPGDAENTGEGRRPS